jgi:hypothetical protein
LEDGLSLAGDAEWETHVGHDGTGVVGGEHDVGGFDLALWLVWGSITIVDATCEFKQRTHFRVECPLTSKLELLSHWHHHVDIDSINSLVLFEHLGTVLDLLECFWFPITLSNGD